MPVPPLARCSPILWRNSSKELKINVTFYNTLFVFRISDKILSEYTKPIFSTLLLRSGEANQRIYNLAIDTGVKIIKTPRLEELDVLEVLLTERITVKEPPKVALSRVKFTKFLVESYGISEEKNDPMSVSRLAGFGVNAVQHQVRRYKFEILTPPKP